MRNVLLTLSYNGKNYHGWQIQENALTVQEVFQESLKKILQEDFLELKGCSRTDSGVHANMYCVNVKINNNKIPCENLKMALNKYLPKDISVLNSYEVPLSFHARYSCTAKEYIYKIWNSPIRNPFLEDYSLHYWHKLNHENLNKIAQDFIGTHDFTSFCTLDRRKKENLTRTVKNFKIYQEKENLIIFKVEADGFLYNMVRIMVGTLLKISERKILPDKIPEIILLKNRKKAGNTVPARGLYLNRVFY